MRIIFIKNGDYIVGGGLSLCPDIEKISSYLNLIWYSRWDDYVCKGKIKRVYTTWKFCYGYTVHGEYYIIECGCLNSVGFTVPDISKLVKKQAKI
jgi:hypothetical protein